MPLGTGLTRPKTSSTHESRHKYLDEKEVSDNKICHVIPNPTESTKEATTPWITLVLGSGCIASRTQVSALAKAVSELRKPTPAPDDIAGMPVKEIIRSFTMDLIEDRLRLRPNSRSGKALKQLVAEALQEKIAARPNPPPGVPHANGILDPHRADWMSGILLTAALITNLYYKIKSLSNDAPRRSDHNDEAILTRESRSWGILQDDYVQPCCAILSDLGGRVEEITESLGTPEEKLRQNLMGTVEGLLARVSKGLTMKEVRVESADLHALAEFAWFCLTTLTTEPVYPGWSDLLLDLSNYDSPKRARVGIPLFQSMTEAQGFIISRYQEVTRKSWARRVARGGAEDDSLYCAAAELLNAQCRYRKAYRANGPKKESRRPPITTAFVTSFDLELELSLLSIGEPFTIVLPVHLLNQKHSVAYTCWIVLGVKGKRDGESHDRLTEILEPDEGSYRILDERWKEAGPVVVRLAGCPLIKLPDLARESQIKKDLIAIFGTSIWAEVQADQERYNKLIERGLQLHHAVIINEHDAILQSEIDLISIPQVDENGTHRDMRYGLPAHFAAGNKHASRFWIMLGVQIHDSAVRQRIVTLISSLPHMAPSKNIQPAKDSTPTTGDDSEEPEGHKEPARKASHRGVAVNKYSTELEEDLLLWNGFDVVRDDVSVFTKDLRHCAAHLDQDDDFNQSGDCHVA